MKKRMVVFGIFDGVHEGHRSLFAQAKEHGDELIVIIGRDEASLQWKGRRPRYTQEERLELVRKEKNVDDVLLGDEEQSGYQILQELKPDGICLGYDQDALRKDLERWMKEKGKNISLVQLRPFEASVYHNSFRAEGF